MSHERPAAPTKVAMPPHDVDLDRVWHGIAGEVWAPRTGWLERQAARLLRSPALARAFCTTPALLLSWVLASVAVFALGAAVARAIDQPVVPLLAPAVAGVAVAFAYGAGADPAWEITRTMAVPARMVLLVRVSAVFATNALMGVAASLIAPSLAGVTILWLVPMVAISMLGLAVAVVARNATVGSVTALATWSAIVLAGQIRTDDVARAVATSTLERFAPLYLMLAVVSLAVTLRVSGDGAKQREVAGWW